MQNKPTLCNCLHPRSDVGEERARQEETIVAMRKRAKHSAAAGCGRLGINYGRDLSRHKVNTLTTNERGDKRSTKSRYCPSYVSCRSASGWIGSVPKNAGTDAV